MLLKKLDEQVLGQDIKQSLETRTFVVNALKGLGGIGKSALLKREGRGVESSAKAQIASSGFDTSSGSASQIQKIINERSSKDAMSALLEGKLGARTARFEGDQMRRLGKAKQKSSMAQAGMTLLGSFK